MKSFIIIFIVLLPFLAIGQCYTGNSDFLKAEVRGDTVVLMDDTACRNCGSYYVMEISRLNDDTLIWMQRDIGDPAYCLCNFNLTVTIDSLSPGNYTTMVYDEDKSGTYTTFIGSISFTITEPNLFSLPHKHDQYQSDCFVVGTNEAKAMNFGIKVYPNPANDFLYIVTNLAGEKLIRISDVQNKSILEFISDKDENSIDISNLPGNIYIVTVKSRGNLIHAKFCKY
jgi:hypothetical protein